MADFRATPAMQLRIAYLTMHRHFQRLLAPYDVTADQFVLMRLIGESPSATQKELVAASGSDPNTIAAMLKRLELRGWITRETCEDDARARRVQITSSGQAKLQDWIALTAASHAKFEALLGHERDTHTAFLKRVEDTMK
jgi:DNA-binding MarR family transcriptional regulator